MGFTVLLLFLIIAILLDKMYLFFIALGGELLLCAIAQAMSNDITPKESKKRKYYLIEK